MTMPGETTSYNTVETWYSGNLTVAVLNGAIPAWRIDDMAVRIIAGFYYVELDTERDPINFSSFTLDTFGYAYYYVGEGSIEQVNHHVDVRGDHATLIRKQGAESTVLLKNVNNTLPLTGKEASTFGFGNDAGPNLQGPYACGDRGCDNGTLGMAWGSRSSNFPYLVTLDTAIQNEVLANGSTYESALNNWALDTIGTFARRANLLISFANSDAGECYLEADGNLRERNNLTFWQNAGAAIERVLGNCSNTILVTHSVGANELEKYKNHPNVTALL